MTAVEKAEGQLDKEATSFDDLFDSSDYSCSSGTKKREGLLVRRKCCTSRLSGTSTTSAECKVVDRKSP